MRWNRVLLLVPLLAALFVVGLVSHGFAIGNVSVAGVVAALKNPLFFLADRSPGERGAGALLSTKPDRTAANTVPHERVLSTVRERQPFLEIPPGIDSPDTGAGPNGLAASNVAPGAGTGPGRQVFGSPPSESTFQPGGFSPASQFFGLPLSAFLPAGGGSIPGGSDAPPSGTIISPAEDTTSPGEVLGLPPLGEVIPIKQSDVPPVFDLGPESPPVLPVPPDTTLPVGPGITEIPEPATWTMMLFGLFAIGLGLRKHKQTRMACVLSRPA